VSAEHIFSIGEKKDIKVLRQAILQVSLDKNVLGLHSYNFNSEFTNFL
jgi:hypothetical protein